MFLYAHLAIEYLLQQPTKGILLEKIREEILPKKLATMSVFGSNAINISKYLTIFM